MNKIFSEPIDRYAAGAVGPHLQCSHLYQPKEVFEVVGKDVPFALKYPCIFSFSPRYTTIPGAIQFDTGNVARISAST